MLQRMKRQGMMVLTAVCVEVSGRTLCSIDRLKKVQKKTCYREASDVRFTLTAVDTPQQGFKLAFTSLSAAE